MRGKISWTVRRYNAVGGGAVMEDTARVQCPYCFEWVEVVVEPGSAGTMVQDCEVCCNPWQMTVTRRRDGRTDVRVERLG